MVVYDKKLLVIRHLPHELRKDEKIDLLKYFGATEVTCISSERKKSSLTFAKFPNESQAENVLKSLHQTDILGQLISVEYARCDLPVGHDVKEKSEEIDEKTLQRELMEKFQYKLNSWITNLDLTLPPPVHLRYSYPPPKLNILKNITKALSKVPKFYTQVLHLMNKMNLPCPFVENYKIHDETLDEESESELEDEIKPEFKMPKIKRLKKLQKLTPKRVKIDVIKPDQVFETVNITKKNIELNIPMDLTPVDHEDKETERIEMKEMEKSENIDENFSLENKEREENENVNRIITAEELALNCVPPRDFHLLPVFKNYQPGPPSCRLYIKNLAKTVQESDLNYIYKRYLVDEEEANMFDIRLLQEGRMKGQAFVTLQNTNLAEKALKETNGFMLKGKPMVVQYARSQKPK